jgi:hypothetical protein
MSINALSSTSAASQISFLNRLGGGNSTSGTEAARRPPPPDGGGFADAIAEALKSIGVTDTSASGTGSTAATDATEATDAGTVADALGSFLQSLMGALHAQNSGQAEAPPPYSEAAGKGGGGSGKLESDLQSLIAKLGSGDTTTGSADGTDAVSELEATFQNLLEKLGGGTATKSTDGTDAGTKLAAFLEALSSKVGTSGSSGNLVNTTV